MNINVIELSKGSRICHVNAHIETNNITALIGENGAGKTTLLQLIASLLKPTSGRIEFEGVTKKRYPFVHWFFASIPIFPRLDDWIRVSHACRSISWHEKTACGP